MYTITHSSDIITLASQLDQFLSSYGALQIQISSSTQDEIGILDANSLTTALQERANKALQLEESQLYNI